MSITLKCSSCGRIITNGSKSGLCKSCCHLGREGYWAGKNRSEKTKRKIRETKLGCIGFWKNKKRENVSGKNHWTTRQDFTLEHRKKLSLSHLEQTLDIHKKDCNCSFCKAKRGEYKLEGNPAWQGGKSFEPYPLGWNKTFKEQIRYRDKYKCQLCDVPEIECNRKLHIHHIDYNKNNINPDNLISLCHSCHAKTTGNRKYWINLFKGEK